jgi:hypothetical protein
MYNINLVWKIFLIYIYMYTQYNLHIYHEYASLKKNETWQLDAVETDPPRCSGQRATRCASSSLPRCELRSSSEGEFDKGLGQALYVRCMYRKHPFIIIYICIRYIYIYTYKWLHVCSMYINPYGPKYLLLGSVCVWCRGLAVSSQTVFGSIGNDYKWRFPKIRWYLQIIYVIDDHDWV